MNLTDLKWPPEPTVAAVIEKDDKFLIVEEESDGLIVFNQPAGHLEANETAIDAIIRETLEETAWHFTPTAIVGIYFYTSPLTGITFQRICFTGNVTKHEPNQALDKGIIQTLWLTREELFNRSEKLRSPMVLKCIDDYLANKRLPLNLITDLRILNTK